MKVAASQFYCTITGTSGTSHEVMKNAFARWGVPYEFGEHTQGSKNPRMYVDPSFADAARKMHEIEKTAMLERKAKKQASKRKPKKPSNGAVPQQLTLGEFVASADALELLRDMNRKLDRILDIWTK
jgi:hypothetical protein